jgi:hypothetical protein
MNLRETKAKATVDQNTLNEVIKLMEKQKLSSMTIDELLNHIDSLKVSDDDSDQKSPVFTFKTPAKVYSTAELSAAFATSCDLNRGKN